MLTRVYKQRRLSLVIYLTRIVDEPILFKGMYYVQPPCVLCFPDFSRGHRIGASG